MMAADLGWSLTRVPSLPNSNLVQVAAQPTVAPGSASLRLTSAVGGGFAVFVDNNNTIMTSAEDIGSFPQAFRTVTGSVATNMTTPVKTCRTTALLGDAAQVMLDAGCGCVPVVEAAGVWPG